MVRFKSRDDSNYQRISGLLKRWAKELDISTEDVNVMHGPTTWFGQNATQSSTFHPRGPLELDGNPSVSLGQPTLPPRVDYSSRRLSDLAQIPQCQGTNLRVESSHVDDDLYGLSDCSHSAFSPARQLGQFNHKSSEQKPSSSSHRPTASANRYEETRFGKYSEREEEEKVAQSRSQAKQRPRSKPKPSSENPQKRYRNQNSPAVIPPQLPQLGTVNFNGNSMYQIAYSSGAFYNSSQVDFESDFSNQDSL